MKRFVIRNYGLSRQFLYKGSQICLSNDQAIETDDGNKAAFLGGHKNIYVRDRGAEFAPPITLPEEPKKERNITVDDAEAVHTENFPDVDERAQETDKTQSPDDDENNDEIAYNDMSVKELQVLAKDRQLKTSGLRKPELIQIHETYDREEE